MRLVLSLGLLLMVSICAFAAPVGWRTDGTGKYPQATPPEEWAADKNVVWSTPIVNGDKPAWSCASPVIVGERIFITAEPDTLMCLSAKDGSILWQHANGYKELATPEEVPDIDPLNAQLAELRKKIGQLWWQGNKVKTELKDKPEDAELKAKLEDLQKQAAAAQEQMKPLMEKWYALPKTYEINGFSTPTPVSDGKNVWALFNHGVAACYDLDGNLIWRKFFEKPQNEYGHSSSPVMADGKLIFHILNLHAVDPLTGNVVWKVRLPEAWGTPVLGRIGDTEIIATSKGNIVRARDGRVLAEKLAHMEYGNPIIADGNVYFIENGIKDHFAIAYKLPAEVTDAAFVPEKLWQTDVKADRYYSSPLLHDGLIYGVTQAGVLSAVDAATGQVAWEQTLNEKPTFYPSITLAGKLLYVSNDRGTTIVIQPGRTCQEVKRLTLEGFRSSPVFAGNRVYIRGLTKLWCLGTQ